MKRVKEDREKLDLLIDKLIGKKY